MDNIDNQLVQPTKQVKQKKQKSKKTNNPKKRNFVVSLVVFLVGLLVLVTGIVFLVLSLNATPAIQDGEYLVDAGEWMLNLGGCDDNNASEKCKNENVIWDFTEIGKGTLTTNAHTNDYDFEWTIKDGKLIIITDWLYSLEDEYEYELNQRSGTLTLKADDKTYVFVAQQ